MVLKIYSLKYFEQCIGVLYIATQVTETWLIRTTDSNRKEALR